MAAGLKAVSVKMYGTYGTKSDGTPVFYTHTFSGINPETFDDAKVKALGLALDDVWLADYEHTEKTVTSKLD